MRGSAPVDLDGLRALRSPEGTRLIMALPAYEERQAVGLASRLRRDHKPVLVSAALTQSRLRARARAKFGTDADRMFFTPEGLEQATRARVAEHRARRFAATAGPVLDLCCGIGGDLLALGRAGLRVTGVDRDPLTAEVAAANVEALGLAERVRVRCAEAMGTSPARYGAVFCDPARRGRRGRVFNPDAYAPPLGAVLDLARRTPALAVKVAPGLPHERVPPDAEAEWVSDDGDVKEAVLWFGALRGSGPPVTRRATLLPSATTLTDDPSLGAPPTGPVGRYLYEPDGAVIRAHLVAEVCEQVGGRLLHPRIAYVTADTPVRTPFATGYEVIDVMPFGVKRLRAYLRERRVGTLTVKKRGSAVDPEQLRRDMRLSGPCAATVVLTRVSREPAVIVVSPL